MSAIAELAGALSRMSEQIVSAHSELVKLSPQDFPAFEVVTIATGESIKFTFGEGWIPSISSNKEDDIVIDVPKKLGIPLMVGYILLIGAQQCLNVHNTLLDNKIKEVELKIKEVELKLRETELQGTVFASEKHVAQLQNEGIEVVTKIQNNEIYKVFMINGVSILREGEGTNLQSEKD